MKVMELLKKDITTSMGQIIFLVLTVIFMFPVINLFIFLKCDGRLIILSTVGVAMAIVCFITFKAIRAEESLRNSYKEVDIANLVAKGEIDHIKKLRFEILMYIDEVVERGSDKEIKDLKILIDQRFAGKKKDA